MLCAFTLLLLFFSRCTAAPTVRLLIRRFYRYWRAALLLLLLLLLRGRGDGAVSRSSDARTAAAFGDEGVILLLVLDLRKNFKLRFD